MKKLLLAVLMCSNFAFAADCANIAQQVVTKLATHNRTAVTLNYSGDKLAQANSCKAAILAKNSALTVTLNEVDGTDKFKFSK